MLDALIDYHLMWFPYYLLNWQISLYCGCIFMIFPLWYRRSGIYSRWDISCFFPVIVCNQERLRYLINICIFDCDGWFNYVFYSGGFGMCDFWYLLDGSVIALIFISCGNSSYGFILVFLSGGTVSELKTEENIYQTAC